MKPPSLRYVRPESLDEALALLSTYPDAKCLAGGQSLVPMLNLRLVESTALVDLARVPRLAEIRRDGDFLSIGALARHRALETSAEVRAIEPLISRAAREVGHLAIRNRGTIGGSLAHADPAAEWPLLAVALDARITLRSPRGERVVPARSFFAGPLTTVLGPAEILTEVRFPVPRQPEGFGFHELSRRAGDFAIVAIACRISIDPSGVCRTATLGVAGAHPTPFWSTEVDRILRGSRGEPAAIDEAAEAVARSVDPGGDVHASATYRRRMVAVLGRRALRQAFTRREAVG